MKKFAKMLVISTALFLASTSCSATVGARAARPQIKQELCTLPPEPAFEQLRDCPAQPLSLSIAPDIIRADSSCESHNLLILLNNITKLKSYAEKLKAVIECLNSAAATQTGTSLSRNIVISPEKSND